MNQAMAERMVQDPTALQRLIANVISLLIALAALGIAVWVLVSGQIGRQGIDALFLILVCLIMAFAFSLMPLQAWRAGEFREFLSSLRRKPAGGPETPGGESSPPPQRSQDASS